MTLSDQNSSTLYNAIYQAITELLGYTLTTSEIYDKTNHIFLAITDDIFFQELARRMETKKLPVSDGPLTFVELKPNKWEYDTVTILDPFTSRHTLNKWGKDGWELVAVDNSLVYFKRQCGL